MAAANVTWRRKNIRGNGVRCHKAGLLGGIALADRLGIASRHRASWIQLYGVLRLAGIGFSMNLFVGGPAFADAARMDAVEIGVLMSSPLSALSGFVVLRWITKPAR